MATKSIERFTRGKSRFYPVDGENYPSVTSVTAVYNKEALPNWAGKRNRERTCDEAATLYGEMAETGTMLPQSWFRSSLWSRIEKRAFHLEEARAAADLGTLAHARCEWVNDRRMGRTVGADPITVGALQAGTLTPQEIERALWASLAYEQWMADHRVEPIATECVVASRKHGYAGTADLVAYVDGARSLVDLKTSSGLWNEMRCQVAAYFTAWNEEHPDEPCERAYLLRLPKKLTDPDFEAREVADLSSHMDGFLHMLGVWRWQESCK
jgi:hypothetical protein